MFFGILLALIVFEISFRLFANKMHAAAYRGDRPRRNFYYASTDSTRNAPYSFQKPADTYRVVAVGDSFTYGTALNLDDTYSKKLERIFNLRNTGPRAEVLNFGIPGFSTSQEIYLVQRAVKLQPDLVILQITLNDPELEPFRVTHPGFNVNGQVQLESPIYKWWKSLAYVRTRLANSLSHRLYEQYYFDLFNNPKSWGNFTQAVSSIKDTVSNHRARLVVVIFPLFSHPLDRRYPFRALHEKIGKMLSEQQIPYLDLLKAYHDMSETRLQISPGKDSHPNEIAHRIAAENIYLWLERHKFIPKEMVVKSKSAKTAKVPFDHWNNQYLSSKKAHEQGI